MLYGGRRDKLVLLISDEAEKGKELDYRPTFRDKERQNGMNLGNA